MIETAGAPSSGLREWTRWVLGLAALALVPAVLALITLAVKVPGLVLGQALETAQIARHVAAGDGLVTDSIRPLSLAVQPALKNHPDLYHAPLHPLLLGCVFRLLHPSDRVDECFGLFIWIVSILLTFWLARRWMGTEVALLATAFYGCNMTMLKGAGFGLSCPLSATLVLLLSAWAAPRAWEEDLSAGPEKGSDLRLVGSALVAALLAMTHYLFFFLAPPVGLAIISSRRRRGRAACLFLIGYFALLLPWMIRNLYWARSPIFSFYWYEALAGTETYPGDSVWRSMAAARSGPWEFGFLHPLQEARKVLSGFIRFWQEGLSVTDPVVTFLAVAGLWGGAKEAWKGWVRTLAAGAVVVIGASCLFRAEPEILLAWTPLLSIAAAAQVTGWLADRVSSMTLRRAWSTWASSIFRVPEQLRTSLRLAGAVTALAIVAIPLVHYLFVYRSEGAASSWESEPLARLLPAGTVVMTDQPAVIAWAGKHPAVWLCLQEGEWDQIEAGGGRIDAAYVSPAVASLPSAPRASWWGWIASPRGVYRNLVPVDAAPLPGALRLRSGGKG